MYRLIGVELWNRWRPCFASCYHFHLQTKKTMTSIYETRDLKNKTVRIKHFTIVYLYVHMFFKKLRCSILEGNSVTSASCTSERSSHPQQMARSATLNMTGTAPPRKTEAQSRNQSSCAMLSQPIDMHSSCNNITWIYLMHNNWNQMFGHVTYPVQYNDIW